MADFNFKQIIRENLYNQQYPHQDKVRIILNEGQTLLLEREIHEGILDFIKNWGQEPKKDKQDVSNLRDKVGAYLDQGALSDDRSREILINHYVKNLTELPASIFSDDVAVAEIGDSLEAGAKGDIEGAATELSNVADLGNPDETPTEEVPRAPKAQGITSWDQYKSVLNKYIQGNTLNKLQTKLLRRGVWAVLNRAGLKIKPDDQGVGEVLAMMKQASTLRAGDISEGITNGDFLKKIFVESVRVFIKNENKK